jgi:hypothetical protein
LLSLPVGTASAGLEAEREKKTTWREFIHSHLEVLAAVDFFTVEVWTSAGLITHYVLMFMRVASRRVCIAGQRLGGMLKFYYPEAA